MSIEQGKFAEAMKDLGETVGRILAEEAFKIQRPVVAHGARYVHDYREVLEEAIDGFLDALREDDRRGVSQEIRVGTAMEVTLAGGPDKSIPLLALALERLLTLAPADLARTRRDSLAQAAEERP